MGEAGIGCVYQAGAGAGAGAGAVALFSPFFEDAALPGMKN